MITLEQHIAAEYKGNITAFAKAHNRSRPLIYRWIASGALWINGQAFDPVTPAPEEAPTPLLQKGGFGAEWVENGGNVMIQTYGMAEAVHLNAADLAAMTEALDNGT